MANIGELTKKEWALMKIIWTKGKTSAKEVFDTLPNDDKRTYVTIKTMLDRLVEKSYLDREKFGPIWIYSPMVTENDLTNRAIDDFVKTVLGNTIAPIFMHMVNRKKKYHHEIEELKNLIDDIEEE